MVQEILSPKIQPRSITMHVDGDTNRSYEALELNAGYSYPLIMLRNTVFSHTEIKSFNLRIGYAFAPELIVVLDDSRGVFTDQDSPIRDELLTLYLGNIRDEETLPIHLDFNVLSANRSAKFQITVVCRCVIPGANLRNYGDLISGNAFDAVKAICETLELGMLSNITGSEDQSDWRYDGRTAIEMLQYCIDHIWNGKEQYVTAFIDQHYRLNLVELTSAFAESAPTRTITRNLLTQEELEIPEELVLNNSLHDYEHTQFRISSWHPINPLGLQERYRPRSINHVVYTKDYEKNELLAESDVSAIEDAERTNDTDVFASGSLARSMDLYKYQHQDSLEIDAPVTAHEHNMIGRELMLQAPHIEVELGYVAHQLSLYTKVPVDIRNTPFRHDQQLKDSDTFQTESENARDNSRLEDARNETFSGEYLITATNFRYTSRTQRLAQQLRLHKRFWRQQVPFVSPEA